MPTPSDNHGFDLQYEQGEEGWSYNEEFEHLEERVPVVDDETNRGDYTPYTNAVFIAADTHSVALGDGSMWGEIGEIVDPANFAAADHNHDSEYAAAGHNHDSEYNNYTFSEDYTDLTNRAHGNEDHSSTFAVDGDAQPPESHGNGAHSSDFAYSSTHSDVDIQIDEANGVVNFVTN